VSNPLILPLAAVISGILFARALTLSAFEAAWPLAVFLLLTLFSRLWAARWVRRCCLGFTLIFVGAFTEVAHRPGPRPQIDAGSRETVLLAGCVVEPSVLSPGRQQFTLELDPGARARVSLPIAEGPGPQRLDYGQRIEIEARIRPPRNFNNPGSFDYAGYLARQNIFWTASMARGSEARVLPGRCGWRAMALIFWLRGAALDRIERLYPPSKDGSAYTAGMMAAMLIGETSQLQKIWTENFRRTGTFHALVISGAHVAVLAGLLLFFLRICAVGEIPALALTAAAAWLYALVSGLSPPVARGWGLHLVPDGALLLSPRAGAEPARRRGPGLPFMRSRRNRGCQLRTIVFVRGGARRVGRTAARSHHRSFRARVARCRGDRCRSAFRAPRGAAASGGTSGSANARSLVEAAVAMVRRAHGSSLARWDLHL
jgi:competence protein ComEC